MDSNVGKGKAAHTRLPILSCHVIYVTQILCYIRVSCCCIGARVMVPTDSVSLWCLLIL